MKEKRGHLHPYNKVMLYQLFLPSWDKFEGLVVVGFIVVSPGDLVWIGRPIMNLGFVDEKVVQEVDSPVDGVVKEIFVKSGDEVVAKQLVMTIEMREEKI